MTPVFAGHSLSSALYMALAVWVLGELGQNLRRRTEARSMDRGSRLVIALSIALGFGLASLARVKVPGAAFPVDGVTLGIGLAIIWAGIGLRWWSIRTLGRYFTIDVMTSADQPVISVGPYSLLRHPSYTGLLLVFAGIGVAFTNWLSLALMILLPLIGLIVRIQVEEAALASTLGDAYGSYAASHKRIIPFVW